MKRKLLSGLALLLLTACHKSPSDGPENTPSKDLILTASQQIRAQADNDFTFSLLNETLAGSGNGENVMVSPLSVSMMLGMAANGAKGETYEAFRKTLGFGDQNEEEINAYYKKLINDLPVLDPKVSMDIANSIWYRQDFAVLPEFLTTNTDYFNAGVEALDFSNPSAADRINQWVDQHTKHRITKIIDEIPADMVMYLINALYFKGDWQQRFDKGHTRKKAFTRADGAIIQTDFMNVEHSFALFGNDEVKGIELPYGDGKYSMIALLPAVGNSPAKLAELLGTEGWWDNLSAQSSMGLVNLWMPKFQFSYEHKKMIEALKTLGLGIAFTERADFSGINGSGSLLISEVKHKTYIGVDEEGSEAAAVTSGGIIATSITEPTPFLFTIDRPFLFLIRENNNGLILFAGQVSDPSAGG